MFRYRLVFEIEKITNDPPHVKAIAASTNMEWVLSHVSSSSGPVISIARGSDHSQPTGGLYFDSSDDVDGDGYGYGRDYDCCDCGHYLIDYGR